MDIDTIIIKAKKATVGLELPVTMDLWGDTPTVGFHLFCGKTYTFKL